MGFATGLVTVLFAAVPVTGEAAGDAEGEGLVFVLTEELLLFSPPEVVGGFFVLKAAIITTNASTMIIMGTYLLVFFI